MGPNEALDELQAALEEGRLSASGQCSKITRDLIGDRRQIEPTRGYVPEVFWQGARIDRDKMDSAVDAMGERWKALLAHVADPDHIWGLKPFHYIPAFYEAVARRLDEFGIRPRPMA